MQQKHFYAYGHKLTFSPSHKKDEDVIQISRCDTSLPPTYSFDKIFFDTNQDREIYMCSPHNLNEKSSQWAFVVKECVTFICDTEKKSIAYIEGEQYSQKLMEYWLIHIVLPLFWTLEGSYYFLHTGSVVVDGKAVLFMGDSYAGKSTMTDFFLQQNHTLLSDDKLATFYDEKSKSFQVHASHPYHRPYRAKEDLGKKAENFEESSFPIGRLYWLQPVDATQDVEITELKGIKKFERLRYSTEMDISLDAKERFRYITKFANHEPLYEVKVPNDLSKLPKVYDKIMEHIKGENI
jgi:hypothetical protein